MSGAMRVAKESLLRAMGSIDPEVGHPDTPLGFKGIGHSYSRTSKYMSLSFFPSVSMDPLKEV